jgi:hypothetical protein
VGQQDIKKREQRIDIVEWRAAAPPVKEELLFLMQDKFVKNAEIRLRGISLDSSQTIERRCRREQSWRLAKLRGGTINGL